MLAGVFSGRSATRQGIWMDRGGVMKIHIFNGSSPVKLNKGIFSAIGRCWVSLKMLKHQDQSHTVLSMFSKQEPLDIRLLKYRWFQKYIDLRISTQLISVNFGIRPPKVLPRRQYHNTCLVQVMHLRKVGLQDWPG